MRPTGNRILVTLPITAYAPHNGLTNRLAERYLAIAQERDLPGFIPLGRMVLGQVHALAGRIPEAVDLLEHARTEYVALQTWFSALEGRVHLGEAYQLGHRSAEASATAAEALRLARDRGVRRLEAYALRLLADVAAHADPPDTAAAKARYDEALALATELGMRPLIAHCHLGLGKLYSGSNPATTKEHLITATAMYREMSMNLWLEKVESALAPPHGKSP
jgi:tetratricopeptide (TPR) repeat protein